MARKTAYIIDLNSLRALDGNGSIVRPPLYAGKEETFLAYIKKGTGIIKVFNKAEYVFEAETEHEVEATAQTIDPVTESYKCDYNTSTRAFDANRTDVDYTGVLSLDRNDSEEERTGTFEVTQPKSGLSFRCRYTQAGKRVSYYYIDKDSISAEDVSYDMVGAEGGDSRPQVTVYGDLYAVYTNGTQAFVDRKEGIAYVSYASGRTVDHEDEFVDYENASIDADTGIVTVSSLYNNETEDAIDVFRVTYMEGSVWFDEVEEPLEWQWSGRAYVQQDVNGKVKVRTDYHLDSYLQKEELEVTDTAIRVYGYAYKTVYYRYDADPGELYGEDSDSTLYVTLDDDPSSVQRLEGEELDYVTFNVGANTEETERTYSVQVYSNETDYDEEYHVTQEAREFRKYVVFSVEATGVDYEEAMPYASKSAPSVVVQVGYKKEFSDGTTDPEVYSYDYEGDVDYAYGTDYGGSGASVNAGTGVVSVNGLPNEWKARTRVFTVSELSGTVLAELTGDTVEWEWSGSKAVYQMENERSEVSVRTVKSSSVEDTYLECDDTQVTVNYQAQDISTYQWASDRYGQDLEEEVSYKYPLTVSISGDYSSSKTVRDGEGSVTFDVDVNESTTEEREFTVKVYSSSLGTIGTHTVEQGTNDEQVYWGAPVLNGTVIVETIPANGEGVAVLVPIKQVQYRTTTLNPTPSVVRTYTDSVLASAIGGTAVSGAGASFDEGYISANNLDKTEMAERKVYTLKNVTVTGQDGDSYKLSLPSQVEVMQEANEKTTVITSSAVDISPTSLTFAATASSKSVVVYAASYKRDDYTSGAKTTYTDSAPVVLSVSGSGSVSPTSMTTTVNGKAATLSVTENIRGARTISLTATANSGTSKEKSITRTYNQSAVAYVLTAGDDVDCNATASTVYVTFTSSRNGKVWEPAFTTNNADATINKSGITLSGTTYTVPVAIKANSSANARDIIVTATQTRYDGDATATLTVTQAGAAQNLPIAGVVLNECMYTSDTLASVSYSLYFTASPSSSYQGGTLSNVVVQLNTAANGSGSVLASRTIGNVTVSRGSSSSTYSGTLNSGGRVAYLLVYWGGSLQFATEVEEYVPEG